MSPVTGHFTTRAALCRPTWWVPSCPNSGGRSAPEAQTMVRCMARGRSVTIAPMQGRRRQRLSERAAGGGGRTACGGGLPLSVTVAASAAESHLSHLSRSSRLIPANPAKNYGSRVPHRSRRSPMSVSGHRGTRQSVAEGVMVLIRVRPWMVGRSRESPEEAG